MEVDVLEYLVSLSHEKELSLLLVIGNSATQGEDASTSICKLHLRANIILLYEITRCR